MATQAQIEIEGFLKKVKAAPIEEISVATATDTETTNELLQVMAADGLVDLKPSRRYRGQRIAISTNKLLRNDV